MQGISLSGMAAGMPRGAERSYFEDNLSAGTYLDFFAQFFGVRRTSVQTAIIAFPFLQQIFRSAFQSAGNGIFFVAGKQNSDPAPQLPGRKQLFAGTDKSRNGSFHFANSAGTKGTVFYFSGKGPVFPIGFGAGRSNVKMSGKQQTAFSFAGGGIKDGRRTGFGTIQQADVKAMPGMQIVKDRFYLPSERLKTN